MTSVTEMFDLPSYNTLDYFKETSETEVEKIIKSSKPTTLDPLPTEIISTFSSTHEAHQYIV